MKKLYCVLMRLDMDVVVLAESEESAEDLAFNSLGEELLHAHPQDLATTASIKQVTDKKELPSGWRRGAVPYGDHNDWTCERWVEETKGD